MASDSRKLDYERNKRRKRLRRFTAKAIDDFKMVEPGDRIMVCVSGGKDWIRLKSRLPIFLG